MVLYNILTVLCSNFSIHSFICRLNYKDEDYRREFKDLNYKAGWVKTHLKMSQTMFTTRTNRYCLRLK